MTTASARTRRLIPVAALVGAGALALTACSGPAESDSAGAGEFTYLGQTENTTIIGTLETLAGGVSINMVTKAGGNTWGGNLRYSFANDDLQSENFDDTRAAVTAIWMPRSKLSTSM